MSCQVMLIETDGWKDEIMHRLAVFESFKRMVRIYKLDITLKPGISLEDTLKHCRRTLESGGIKIVALFSPGNPDGAYADHTVKAISNGNNWALLDDALKAYGFVEQKEEKQ